MLLPLPMRARGIVYPAPFPSPGVAAPSLAERFRVVWQFLSPGKVSLP